MKTNIFIATLIAFLLCSRADAQIENPPQMGADLCERLSSPSRSIREKAVREVYQKNGSFYFCLVQKFDDLQKNQPADSHSFEGSFTTIIQVIGGLRINSAIGRLFYIVDFQLDPSTVPIVQDPKAIQYYPAAYALSEIGGKEVLDTIFQEITLPSNDIRLRLYSSILVEILGKDLALLAVKQKVDSVKKELARIEQEGSSFQRNLEIMQNFLEGNERILYTPKPKTPETIAPVIAPTPK